MISPPTSCSRTSPYLPSPSFSSTLLFSAACFPDALVSLSYIPYTPEASDITSCGVPVNYNASKEWADKKVVLFAVPGAFTPSCSVRHLPGYIEKLEEIKAKSVDVVAVLAFNDAFVMSAWGKANGIKGDDIVSNTDPHPLDVHLYSGLESSEEPENSYIPRAPLSPCITRFLKGKMKHG